MTRFDPSDDELFERLRSGEGEAFTLLYRRWQGPLYRFALRMSGAAATAEDVVQEVFMALIHRADGYDPTRGRLGPYLYGMARNKVLQRLQRERAYVPLVSGADGEPSAEPASCDDPLLDLTRRERIEAVRAAILSLPTHYREAVVLGDLQGLSYEDAAAALGCAVGTVRSRLHRGRELLLAKLRTREGVARVASTRTAEGVS